MPTSSWGPYVWEFIHTFCYHIEEDFFNKNSTHIKDLLFMICSNVPCPICKSHAKNYLSRVSKNKIKTKEDCKRFFYDFHNVVNQRTNKPQFTNYDIYANYSLRITYINFIRAYTNNPYLRNQLHMTLIRERISKKVTQFLLPNKKHFGY